MDQLIESHNKIVTAIQGQAQGTQITTTPQDNRVQQLKELAEVINAVGPTVERIFNKPQATQILDQAYINEKIAKSAMGSFEIGEALTDVIKQKITGKAVQDVVKQIVSHEPA